VRGTFLKSINGGVQKEAGKNPVSSGVVSLKWKIGGPRSEVPKKGGSSGIRVSHKKGNKKKHEEEETQGAIRHASLADKCAVWLQKRGGNL